MDVRIVVDDQYRQPPLRLGRNSLLDRFRAGRPPERVHHDVAALIGAKNMRPSRSFLRQSDRLLLDLQHFGVVMQRVVMNEREMPHARGCGKFHRVFISAVTPVFLCLHIPEGCTDCRG